MFKMSSCENEQKPIPLVPEDFQDYHCSRIFKIKHMIYILVYNLFYCLARRAGFFLLVEDHYKVEL